MDAYSIGILVGRFLMSVLIVYVVVLLCSRFSFQTALKRMKGVIPILATVLIFLLGVAMTLTRV